MIGPLLFLIYSNDLPCCTKHVKSIMFADDTTLVISGPNLASLYDKMNEDLVAVSKWCNSNSLKINAQKCDYMIFNKKPHQNQLNISIQGVAISRVNHFKYLGIIILMIGYSGRSISSTYAVKSVRASTACGE